jgi:prepilin-type N-terminal cleavage/methylation domain-containing protein
MAAHERRHRERQRGVTLSELLVVVAIIALAVAVAIPIIGGAVRSANARAAANLLSVNLRAARMIAVMNHELLPFSIQAEPHPRCFCTPTFYEYEGADGRVQRYTMPRGVTIASSSAPLQFRPNGSVTAPSTTVIRAELAPGNVELWTIETTLTGVTTIRHSREER